MEEGLAALSFSVECTSHGPARAGALAAIGYLPSYASRAGIYSTPAAGGSPPRRSPRQHEPSPSPPASYRALKKQMRGLVAAQAFEATRAGALQIELLQADIDERDRKFRKYGRW